MARELKAHVPDLPLVGSGLSYLQDFLPHSSQGLVREGWVDFVGMGRMTLAYPHLPGDTLSGQGMQRRLLSSTFQRLYDSPEKWNGQRLLPLSMSFTSFDPRESGSLSSRSRSEGDGSWRRSRTWQSSQESRSRPPLSR